VPTVSLIDQRQRSLLREGNFWEPAHFLAQQTFVGLLSSSATAPGMRPPRVRTLGTWWQSWWARARVKKLWRLAQSTRPQRISAAQWQHLQRDLEAFRAAVLRGEIQLEAWEP
jgi:hypothetical protein